MQIKVINQSANPLPHYQTEHAAGMDLHAHLPEPVSLGSLARVLVPTGIYIEIPPGYEAQIRPRSGLAYRHGITVLNSPGTIDADYRGEIKVLLVNLSPEEYTIQPGDRVAQMVVAAYEQVVWQTVDTLSETSRGSGGYGSTGARDAT